MTLDTALTRWRTREEAQFRSTCTIKRNDGEPVFDPGTGQYTQAEVVVYDGACKVKLAAREGEDVEAGETEVRLLDFILTLPADTAVQKDDRVLVDSSPDTGLAGKQFRVTDVLVTDWQVTRKAVLEEVV